MTITLEHIDIFNKYSGDGDHLVRVGTSKEHELFQGEEWSFIEQTFQDLELINKGLVSVAYENKAIEQIKYHIDRIAFSKFMEMSK